MKTLVCPHCCTQVNERASVCVGCGAEIVRGATRQERSTAGVLVAAFAFLVAMAIMGMGIMGPLPDNHDDAALFLVFKLIGLVIIANYLGGFAMRLIRRSSLRFFRVYEHQ